MKLPNPTPPYIQYYSPAHDAFIIERADGTDSRLFGARWIKEDAQRMTNGAWSPSGEWYAFISTKYVDGWLRGQDVVVIDVSDSRALTTVNQIEHEPDFVQWFEEADVLLVSTIDGFPSDYPFERYFYVIDVATDSILTSFTLSPREQFPCCVIWSGKFQSFIIHDYDDLEQADVIYLVDANGNVQKHTKPGDYFGEVESSGWMLGRANGMQYLENIFTGERMHIQEMFLNIRYHDSFAYLYDCEREGALCLIDLETEQVIHIPPDFRVIATNADTGQLVLWNAEYEVFLMDTATGDINPTDIVGGQQTYDAPPAYWGEDGTLVISEQILETVTLMNGSDSRSITLPFKLSYSPLKFSSDGEWIGNVSHGANTYDLNEDIAYSHQPHSHSLGSVPGGDIIWHSEESWLIARQVSYIAGGDDKFRWLNVANADGSFNRELPFMCANYETGCIDWLPTGVDVSRLPAGRLESYLEQPEIRPASEVYIGEFVSDITWSEDGQHLQVDHAYSADISFITDAQVVEQLPDGAALDISCGNCITRESDHFFLRPKGNSVIEIVDKSTDTVVLEFNSYGATHTEVTPDHHYLFHISGPGDPLQLWDLTTQEMVYELPRGVSVFAISPDGTKLAAGVSWEVWIWEIEDLVGGG